MPLPEEPSEDLHIVDYMKLERVMLTVALKASMSMVRRIIYKCVVATAPRLGHLVKMAARELSRRSAEDSQKSLAHAHTFVEKSTSETFKKNGVSRWTPQRKPQKKHRCMFEACKSAPGCLTALLPSPTEQFIPSFIGTLCRKTINTSNVAQLRMDVATGHWPDDVKQ